MAKLNSGIDEGLPLRYRSPCDRSKARLRNFDVDAEIKDIISRATRTRTRVAFKRSRKWTKTMVNAGIGDSAMILAVNVPQRGEIDAEQ